MICACSCKKEFEPRRANQKYRTPECKERARRQRSVAVRLTAEERKLVDRARTGTAAVVPRGNHPFPGYSPKKSDRRLSGPLGPGLMTTKEVAKFLGVSEWQLRYWRMRNRGPAFTKLGRKRCVRYLPSDVIAFVRNNRMKPRSS